MKKNTIGRWLVPLLVLAALALGYRALVPSTVAHADEPIIAVLSEARIAVAGNAVSKAPSGSDNVRRGAISIRNEDSADTIFVKAVLSGSTAPTTTTVQDTTWRLGPGESQTFGFGPTIDVYLMSNSGDGTTSNVYVVELHRGDSMVGVGRGESAVVSGTVTLGAGSALVGSVNFTERSVSVDLTIPDSATMVTGDLIVDSTLVAAIVRENDARGLITGIVLVDEANTVATPADVDVYFVAGNHDWGTPDSAVALSIANSENVVGRVRIAAADWVSINATSSTGMRMATKTAGDAGMPMPIRPVTGTDDIYVVLVARGNIDTSASTTPVWRIEVTSVDRM